MTLHLPRAVRAAAFALAALFVFAPAVLAADGSPQPPSTDATIKALTQKLLEATDAELHWRAVAIDQAALLQRLEAPDNIKAKSVPVPEPPAAIPAK